MMSDLFKLRKYLHKFPELSGHEKYTSEYLITFIKENTNAEIIEKIGGYGFAAIFEFTDDGPVVLFRCDLDGTPIHETNPFDHCSIFNEVSHMCGHDGHMTIMAGFALTLNDRKDLKGKIILLFQPAEENAIGAKAVIEDPKFKTINPDYVFALHNLPGYPMHQIIIEYNQFTPTVQSLAIKFTGKPSHAAQPEKGRNPAYAVSELIQKIKFLSVKDLADEKFVIITPVYLITGSKDYGISPGYGELHYTIRTSSVKRMEEMMQKIKSQIIEVCKIHQLDYEFDTFDYFPSVRNNKECTDIIIKAAEFNNLQVNKTSISFGEDFGWFTQHYKSSMFGLGAGIKTPALHNNNYDFPEELLGTGIKMFESILNIIIKSYY